MEADIQLKNNRTFKRKKKLEQDLEHVTQEMYRRNAELAEINRTLSLLRTIDTLVLDSQGTIDVLCKQITEAVTSNSNFVLCTLMVKKSEHSQLDLLGLSITPELLSNKLPLELENLRLKINDEQSDTHLAGFRHLAHIPDKHIAEILKCPEEIVPELRAKLPINSLYSVKLMVRKRLVGIMTFGFLENLTSLSPTDKALIDRLGDAIGVALDNRLLFEENQLVLKKLQQTNQKLRDLDQTKDEFISMASHQLRTPLTSIKGYTSMVLEGDAGKITANQKQLLNQAFFSAQRMVYLIADLLNVSRLRTGKFIIENKPTQLADVIETEIEQLVESAKTRNLELVYVKPKKFPILMLDETKIRQVIMNFVDNAIYYTPAGGHIHVNLEDRGESVQLTVVDDGLGVPKAEQHHLFTKFYRAGNAKKARPDGTGLGLFMAKKVIVTQGGGIIFTSEEGKGSTFGFTFPKAKMLPPRGLKLDAKAAKVELK